MPVVICAPDPDTVVVSIAAMRVVIFACVSALGVALLAIIGRIEHDPGPNRRGSVDKVNYRQLPQAASEES